MGCAASQTLGEKKNDFQDRKRRRKKRAHDPSTADELQQSTLSAKQRAEDLEQECKAWASADAECRRLSPWGPGDRRPSVACSAPSAVRRQPHRSRGRTARFADNVSVAYTPVLEDYGPRLHNEVYFQQEEFNRMFQERRNLAIKAAKQRLQGIPIAQKPDPDESRRGLGIDPLEVRILGKRRALKKRQKEEREQVLAIQQQASRDGEDWSDVYDQVASAVNDEESLAHQLTTESATAARRLAEAEHRQLFRDSPSLQKLSQTTLVAACPARARRRRESLTPTGDHPTRVGSLVALEELRKLESRATSHIVCDAGDEIKNHPAGSSLPSPLSPPDIPRDKFHTLIRADSLNNHRWQESEANCLVTVVAC